MFINSKKNGFTLVELVVVITILGILSSAAFGMFMDGMRRAYNAKRDADVRAIVSSSRSMKVNMGVYPKNAVEFYNKSKSFISNAAVDPKSSFDMNRLGTTLTSYTEQEYTFSYLKAPQAYSDDRVMASAYFEPDKAGAVDKNTSAGRYKVGTMWGPTSEEMWTQGFAYSTGQTNPGTVLLAPEEQ